MRRHSSFNTIKLLEIEPTAEEDTEKKFTASPPKLIKTEYLGVPSPQFRTSNTLEVPQVSDHKAKGKFNRRMTVQGGSTTDLGLNNLLPALRAPKVGGPMRNQVQE